MIEWITHTLNGDHSQVVILSVVFIMGMFSVVTCVCNYALFAVVAGYSGASGTSRGSRENLLSGIAFLTGIVVTMAGIGYLSGLTGALAGSSLGLFWSISTGLICILFGLYSLDFLPFRVPQIKIKSKRTRAGYIPSVIFGLTTGGISTAMNTCCNPVFPIILATSILKGSALWGLLMLTAFALGFAIPLALGFTGMGWSAGKLSASVRWIGILFKYGGGIILLIMGFYFLLSI